MDGRAGSIMVSVLGAFGAVVISIMNGATVVDMYYV